jgi:FPC/CPF motif-containing protein YcgG
VSGEAVLARAYLEHAVHELLRQPDLNGDAIALAARILDVEDILSETMGAAATVPPCGGAAQFVTAAVYHLVLAADPVSESALTELQQILVEMHDHGQR